MGILRVATAAVIAAASLTFAAGAATAETDTAACSTEPTGGLVRRTIGDRFYLVEVPAGMTGPATLIVSLHGWGMPAETQANGMGWRRFAPGHNLILAVPQAAGWWPTWQFGQGSADVAFLRQLVADVSATWCVDPRHVHVEGISNGGLMAGRVACDAPDLFASAAFLATGPPTVAGSPCTPSRPISVGIFGGLLDPLHLLGGPVNRQLWLGLNGCPSTGTPEPFPRGEALRYGPCAAVVEVVWRTYFFQSHNWPFNTPLGPDNDDVLNRIWTLFQDNPLP